MRMENHEAQSKEMLQELLESTLLPHFSEPLPLPRRNIQVCLSSPFRFNFYSIAAGSPMASVFAQLELNTDLFLQLQAAAKKFMLDPDYPERAECVGNRSKGDADMTKLKLFGCVESFLEDGGWGEKCWGKSAPPLESKAPRRLRWPELRSQ
jgi:hypothetical protein